MHIYTYTYVYITYMCAQVYVYMSRLCELHISEGDANTNTVQNQQSLGLASCNLENYQCPRPDEAEQTKGQLTESGIARIFSACMVEIRRGVSCIL